MEITFKVSLSYPFIYFLLINLILKKLNSPLAIYASHFGCSCFFELQYR